MIIPYSNEWQTVESAISQIKELKATNQYKRVFRRGKLQEDGRDYTKIYLEDKSPSDKLKEQLREVTK